MQNSSLCCTSGHYVPLSVWDSDARENYKLEMFALNMINYTKMFPVDATWSAALNKTIAARVSSEPSSSKGENWILCIIKWTNSCWKQNARMIRRA